MKRKQEGHKFSEQVILDGTTGMPKNCAMYEDRCKKMNEIFEISMSRNWNSVQGFVRHATTDSSVHDSAFLLLSAIDTRGRYP